uniref:Uncharacterized protein n=1 Tax=viral metagenome TaxID=1070528 RepID=A0A6C0H2T8_9ZZZZ
MFFPGTTIKLFEYKSNKLGAPVYLTILSFTYLLTVIGVVYIKTLELFLLS